MPLNEESNGRVRLLRRLALVHGHKLLLQLCEEVLSRGHEVGHVACPTLVSTSVFGALRCAPREPHAPLLLFGTESPWTLWYTDGWSWAVLIWERVGSMASVPEMLSRYSASWLAGLSY